MKTHHQWQGWVTKIGLIVMIGVSISACSDHWKEEVVLHDGSKIIVERSQGYGGRSEIGQSAPIKEQDITFTVPGAKQPLSFKSESSDDIDRANFNLLALHILNGKPYLVVDPNGCLSYNKWGRPNPPYLIFKHDGKSWQRIPLAALPSEFKDINLVISTKKYAQEFSSLPFVSAELVRKRNSELFRSPEFNSILREPLPKYWDGCPEVVFDKGAWVGPGGSK